MVSANYNEILLRYLARCHPVEFYSAWTTTRRNEVIQQMPKNGDIMGTEVPLAVKQLDSLFAPYELPAFGRAYRKAKLKL